MTNKLLTILSIILLTTSLSFANLLSTKGDIGGSSGGPKQSWEDIFKNPNLRAVFPSYKIEDRDIEYHYLCLVTADIIRTKYKQKLPKNSETNFFYDHLYTSRIDSREVCVEEENGVCTNTQIIQYEIPLKASIQVYKKDLKIKKWTKDFEKEFEMLYCENWKF